MRRLILKLLIFHLSLAVLFAFPAWVFLVSGEWLSADFLVWRLQQVQPVMISPAYSNQGVYIKLKSAQERTPAIVSLGTSRVLQFRANFFNASFFNAGIGGLRLWDYRTFVEHLKVGDEPKLLIVGLDHNYFNPNFILSPRDMFNDPPGTNWVRLLSAWDDIYLDWLKRKFKISDLTKSSINDIEYIGLLAKSHKSGCRNDGSYLWYWWETHEKDLQNIANNEDVYIRSNTLSEKSFAEVTALLSLCKQRGITVAGFLPPFSPSVYNALKKERVEFACVFETAGRLKSIFEQYGFPFEDFTDPAAFQIEKDGFHDGQHASEKAYLRLWASWAEREPALKSYSA